jgi:hypothetical protein
MASLGRRLTVDAGEIVQQSIVESKDIRFKMGNPVTNKLSKAAP